MQQTNNQPSAQFLRQRKMLLFIPVLVIPMLTLAFYALGGGKGEPGSKTGNAGTKGYNKNLPAAHFDKKERALDKLGFYAKADQDSAKMLDRMKQDPYYLSQKATLLPGRGTGAIPMAVGSNKPMLPALPNTAAPAGFPSQADAVLQKLEQLKRVIGQPGSTLKPGDLPAGYSENQLTQTQNPAVMGNLANVLQKLQQTSASTSDPQLDKLDGMLNKLLRIEHPDEGQKVDTMVPVAHQEPIALTVFQKDQSIGTLTGIHEKANSGSQGVQGETDSLFEDEEAATGFMNIDDQSASVVTENTIPAVINQDQVLTAGATVELRLSAEAILGVVHIPKDNLLYGVASLNGERLNILINSVRYQHAIYPVSLQVYDLDGLPGIRIPGAISRDVTKESAEEGINGLDVGSLSPTLGGQAVNAGVQATKTLLSRKVKLVRVSLKAGYEVLLKNTKTSLH